MEYHSNNRKALIIGATGLIGQQLVEQLLASNHYSDIQVLVRKTNCEFPSAVKVTVASFDDVIEQPENYRDVLAVDDLFSTLGTTLATVQGNKAQFRKVDYDYPLEIAKLCADHGAQRVFAVSSLGAHSNSPVFYNRVKGEMEDAIAALLLDAVHIYRPSLLLGNRDHLDQAPRSGEALGQKLAVIFAPLMLGPLKRYRPTAYQAVAKAMVDDSKREQSGVCIHYFPR